MEPYTQNTHRFHGRLFHKKMLPLFRRCDTNNIVSSHCRWQRFVNNQFVPTHAPARKDDIKKLENFLCDKSNVIVLTGAGISTESGNKPERVLYSASQS